MRKIISVFLVVCQLVYGALFAQNSKKESLIQYRQMTATDIAEFKQGEHLEWAKTFTLEKFMEYYIEKGQKFFDKKYGSQSIEELYRDSSYIYFGHLSGEGLLYLIKVARQDLDGINFQELDGNEIRKKFIEEVVPNEDKERVKSKDNCSMGSYLTDFTYFKYYSETKEIEIGYKWKINCEFLYKIINKTYIARYNIDTKTFSSLLASGKVK